MNDFEKELAQISQDAAEEPEVKLPSLEEQKAIAAELKKARSRRQVNARNFGAILRQV